MKSKTTLSLFDNPLVRATRRWFATSLVFLTLLVGLEFTIGHLASAQVAEGSLVESNSTPTIASGDLQCGPYTVATPYPLDYTDPRSKRKPFDVDRYIRGQRDWLEQVMGIIPAFVRDNYNNVKSIYENYVNTADRTLNALEDFERELYHMGNSIPGVIAAYLQHLIATFGPNFGQCFDFDVVGVCELVCLKVEYNWPTEVGDIGQMLTTSHIWKLYYQIMRPLLESDALYDKAPIQAYGELGQLSNFLRKGPLGAIPQFSRELDLAELIPDELKFGHAPWNSGQNMEPHVVPAMAQVIRAVGKWVKKLVANAILPNLDFLPKSLSDFGFLDEISPELKGLVEIGKQVATVAEQGMEIFGALSNAANVRSLSDLASSINEISAIAAEHGVEGIPQETLLTAVNHARSAQNLLISLQGVASGRGGPGGTLAAVAGSLQQAQQTIVQFGGENTPELGQAAYVLGELSNVAPLIGAFASVQSPQDVLAIVAQLNVMGQIPLLNKFGTVMGALTELQTLASLQGVLGVLSQLNVLELLGVEIGGVLGEILGQPMGFFGSYLAAAASLPVALVGGALIDIFLTCHPERMSDHVLMDSPFHVDFGRYPSLSALMSPEFFQSLWEDPLMCLRADIGLGAPLATALPSLSRALQCLDPELGFETPEGSVANELCLPGMGAMFPFTSYLPNVGEELGSIKQTIKTLAYTANRNPKGVFPFNKDKSRFQFIDGTPLASSIFGGLLGPDSFFSEGRCFGAGIEGTKFKVGAVDPNRGHQRVLQHWSRQKCCLCPITGLAKAAAGIGSSDSEGGQPPSTSGGPLANIGQLANELGGEITSQLTEE